MTVGPLDKIRLLRVFAADKRLTAADLRCAIVLVDLHNKDKGYAYPSYDYLAKETGCGRSSVWRAVKTLNRLGLIKKSTGGKGRRTNHYRAAFLPPKEQKGVLRGDAQSDANIKIASKSDVAVLSLTPHQSQRWDSLGLNDETQSYNYPAKQGSSYRGDPASGGASPGGARRAGGSNGGDSEFETFWGAYPKQVGRAEAIEQYEIALQSKAVTAAELLAGAKQYAAATAHYSDPKYIKFPANWLSKKCWLENPQPPRPKLKAGDVAARSNAKPEKTKKKKLRVSGATLANRAAEERLAAIKARDKLQTIPSLGRIGRIEFLEGPNWRSVCVVRDLDTMRITKTACGHFVGPSARSILQNMKDERDGKISSSVAVEERKGLAIVNRWTQEQLEEELALTRRSLEQLAVQNGTPASRYDPGDFG